MSFQTRFPVRVEHETEQTFFCESVFSPHKYCIMEPVQRNLELVPIFLKVFFAVKRIV
jgi:hypothetical protein